MELHIIHTYYYILLYNYYNARLFELGSNIYYSMLYIPCEALEQVFLF